MYQTAIELHRGHFDCLPDLSDEHWWSPVQRNARDGIVIRRIYSRENEDYYSEYVGMMLRHGEDEWKWKMDEQNKVQL